VDRARDQDGSAAGVGGPPGGGGGRGGLCADGGGRRPGGRRRAPAPALRGRRQPRRHPCLRVHHRIPRSALPVVRL